MTCENCNVVFCGGCIDDEKRINRTLNRCWYCSDNIDNKNNNNNNNNKTTIEENILGLNQQIQIIDQSKNPDENLKAQLRFQIIGLQEQLNKNFSESKDMCDVCSKHKSKIIFDDINLGIFRGFCYCCGEDSFINLSKCSFCNRTCCNLCTDLDNERRTISCVSCHPPIRTNATPSGRWKNCCVWFMKANNIKFKENMNDDNNNNNEPIIKEKN